MWFAAYYAAKDWGCPPWLIMGEPFSDWTAIKWLIRRGLIEAETNKRNEHEQRKRELSAKRR